MTSSRRLLPVFWLFTAFVVATSAQAKSSPQDYTGTWAMNFGQRTFVVLVLKNRHGNFTGTLSRPEHFELSDGVRFSHISPGITKEKIVSGSMQNGHLHFVTENPKDRTDRSEFDVALTDQDHASIKLTGVSLAAWSFNRSRSRKRPAVSTDWDPKRSYSRDDEDSAVSNAEMQRIYEADQKPRQNPGNISTQEWTIIGEQDATRQSQTHTLLADGQLHSGEDFTRAAFIFQHGSSADDYLLAHTLAMIAVARGDESASWIASATLDRYLQSIGKSQIYGTQFKADANDEATQEPYNRDLIVDALRRHGACQRL